MLNESGGAARRFPGVRINRAEGRPVLHPALRGGLGGTTEVEWHAGEHPGGMRV